MFNELPYQSKIEVCRLFYYENYKWNDNNIPKEIYFSYNWVEFERNGNNSRVKRNIIERWYHNNINLIRKYKLLSITKREMEV